MTDLAPPTGNLPVSPARISGLAVGSPVNGASGGPRTSPLARYLAAVKRVRWLVLLLTLAGLGAGIVLSRLLPQSYVVKSTIQLSPGVDVGDQLRQLISTYSIVEPVVVARKLYIRGPKRVGGPPLPLGPSGPARTLFNGFGFNPAKFAPGSYRLKISPDGRTWDLTNVRTSAKEHGSVGDSVGRAFGFQWPMVVERRWFGQTFEFDALTSRETADEIKRRMSITLQPPRLPQYMYLTLDGPDGPSAEGTLNDLMQQFVVQVGVNSSRELTRAARVLDSQLTQETIRLHDYQRQLQTYRTKIVTLPREELPVAPGLAQTSPGAFSSYQAKTQQLYALQRDRRDLSEALARDTATPNDPVVDQFTMIPTVKSSPALTSDLTELMTSENQLRQYRMRYEDAYRDSVVDMPRLIQHVHDLRMVTIPTTVHALLRNLNAAIARTDSEVKAGATELQNIPTRAITEEDLRREEDVQAKIVDDLTVRYQQARTREASAVPYVTVLDPAVAPLTPNKNKKAMLIALGAIAGLGAGLALALLLDVTDKRVRYADQISAGLGLTILGVIPEIRRAKGEQPSSEEAGQVIEAFRTVRLNLAHTVGESHVTLTISSPSPGDGKSLIASNLALSFAESGYRTLLIDGDTRRGELHRTFGAERRPGLLDYLVGELALDALLRPTTHPQLQLITSGSRKRNAPELLGTTRMRELLGIMRDRFDVVIVDSPPMGAGIDPFVLATLTNNLMLVLRAGATERDLAEAKLQIVDQLPIRLVGAVLNDVRATMSDYKYYSYSYGYGAVDEGSLPAAIAAVVDRN